MLIRRFVLTIAAVGLILLMPIAASAQGQCAPLTGQIEANFVGYWLGSVTFEVGGLTYTGTATTYNTGVTKGGPASTDHNWIGTEETYITFDDGSSLELSTKFRTVHMTDISRFYVNETTDIVGGSGVFEGATGSLTSHGPFAFMTWLGKYHGNICGI